MKEKPTLEQAELTQPEPKQAEQPAHPYPKPRRKDVPHDLADEVKWDIVLHICERIAEGEFLIHITREENMPCPSTFRNWLRAHSEFARIYADALIDRIEWLQSETLDAAEAPVRTYKDSKDNQRVDPADVSIHNARIRTLQWLTNSLIARHREQTEARSGPVPKLMLNYLADQQREHQKATGENLPLLHFKEAYFQANPPIPLD